MQNSIHDNIKVELGHIKDRTECLNMTVVLDKAQVCTNTYTKPTNKQLYLRKSSYHPPSTKNETHTWSCTSYRLHLYMG